MIVVVAARVYTFVKTLETENKRSFYDMQMKLVKRKGGKREKGRKKSEGEKEKPLPTADPAGRKLGDKMPILLSSPSLVS